MPVWVRSNGGPLLLLPVAVLAHWSGSDPPAGREVDARFRWNPDGPATDYDRACDVADYAGVIPVGGADALVLGDEPSDTTWLSRPDGGILVRWIYAPSHDEAEQALASLPPDPAWEPAATFRVTDSPLELFDAAEPGAEPVGERLRVDLPAGDYDVTLADYKPSAAISFQLVRLRRAAS